MFKILVVLVVGAFIVSQAKPYHPQYLERRIQKRDAEKVANDYPNIFNNHDNLIHLIRIQNMKLNRDLKNQFSFSF
jgi:hypothetical protein